MPAVEAVAPMALVGGMEEVFVPAMPVVVGVELVAPVARVEAAELGVPLTSLTENPCRKSCLMPRTMPKLLKRPVFSTFECISV